jgi:hypothetical protein
MVRSNRKLLYGKNVIVECKAIYLYNDSTGELIEKDFRKSYWIEHCFLWPVVNNLVN